MLTTGFGVGAADALAYGVILQAVEIATAVALGLPALVREGVTWSDMRLRALSAPRRCACSPSRGDRERRAEIARSRLACDRARRLSCRSSHPERLRDPDRQKPPQPAELPDGARHGATAGTDGGEPPDAARPDTTTSSPPSRERVVVFDGGMGATLEQFDLTQEDYGGLEGKCHEALVLNRPDVIEGVHASMLEAGAEVVETDTFQGSPAEARRVGAGRAHARDQHARPPRSPARPPGEERFVAGSIGPTGFLPATDDPTLGDIRFARAGRGLRRAGAAAWSRAAPT